MCTSWSGYLYGAEWYHLTNVSVFFYTFEYSFAYHKRKQYSGKESGGAGVFPFVQAGDDDEKPMVGIGDRPLL